MRHRYRSIRDSPNFLEPFAQLRCAVAWCVVWILCVILGIPRRGVACYFAIKNRPNFNSSEPERPLSFYLVSTLNVQ